MARLIRSPEVVKKTGLSKTTIWRLEKKGKFPKRKKIGYSIAWIEAEVDKWIADLRSQS